MNTGTLLDLTPFGSLLTGIGILYCLIALACIALALWLPKRRWIKAVAALTVLAAFGLPVINHVRSEQQLREQANARFAAAKARFEERCKSAGPKIHRTVENVDGLLLLNVRPVAKPSDRSDPNWPDAALPNEAQGDWYIRTFLFWEHRKDERSPRGFLNEQRSDLPGYRFVDVKAPDGTIYRYRLAGPENATLSREILNGQPARYAVSFTNMVDPDDRKNWVAGTRVSIIDTSSNDVIAEHTWFSFEPGQGSTVGFRAPWGFAHTCPDTAGWTGRAPTRFFVEQILKRSRDE